MRNKISTYIHGGLISKMSLMTNYLKAGHEMHKKGNNLLTIHFSFKGVTI